MVKFYSLFLASCCLLSVALPSFSQDAPVTIVPQVTIVEVNKKFFSDDQSRRIIDLKTVTPEPAQNLGYILEKQSSALIRNYGSNGALASISLHGTGSNHTQVNWNGFPLNSPSSGQIDLSLVPSTFIQSVEIINGASGALFGSSTFGGSINLNNEPDWNNQVSVNYTLSSGSYGSFGHFLALRTGNRRIQYQLCAVSDRSDNNFTYKDHYQYKSPVVKNTNGFYRSLGLVQNLFLNLDRGHHVEAGLWIQHKSIEIPALMGSSRSGLSNQRDSLLRSFISYRKTAERSALVIKSAYFTDFLNYTSKSAEADTFYALDSRISTMRLLNEADYRFYLSKKIAFGGGVAFNRMVGKSNNYGGTIGENEFAAYGNLRLALNQFIMNIGLRKEFYEGLNPKIQYAFGVCFRANDRLVLRSHFSSKFRKPTFNEKYWNPGGNPQLKPEKGNGGELTAEITAIGQHDGSFWLDAKITGYYQSVDNWIQWVIHDSLTPVEYKKVRASGTETWIEYGIHSGSLRVKGFFNHNYNRSMIVSTYDNNASYEGKQLMYIPLHTLKAGCEAQYKGLLLGFTANYTGMRETVETGDAYLQLPGYTVMNIHAGLSKEVWKVNLACNFRVENVFNKAYEVIRAYPLPGRTYHLSLMIGWNKTNSEN